MPDSSPNELGERLQADVVVLDVRHPDDFEAWHIPNSTNVDVYDELTNDPQAAKQALQELPNEKETVTVCAAGVVSRTATDRLREMGYDAVTLTDGMNDWSRVHRRAPVPVDPDGRLIQVACPGKGCLSHVLVSDGNAAVFDPSHYVEEYGTILEDYDAEVVGVFDTHAHADHVSGAADLADAHGAPYYRHPEDALAIDATPIEDSNAERNAATLYESLQRLLERPDEAVVLPAHDPGSPEPPVMPTLSEVRDGNDDLERSREEFVEALASDVPDHPPNFERVKRTNVGQESVPDDELAALELGPNNCAAE